MLACVFKKKLLDFYRPPDGCLQYHVGATGRIKTFNFDESTAASYQHLASQQ